MKINLNTFIFLLHIFNITFCFGQDEEISSRQLYIDYLGNINTNDLETNFLLNKGFIDTDEIESLYQFIETYEVENEGEVTETATLVPPMSQMDPNSWISTYSSILTSNTNESLTLETLEEISNRLKENTLSFTEIPLLIFDVKGELLEETEIENSISGSSKANSYNQIHLFGGISFINKFYTQNILFKISVENYFSDDITDGQIFIDFADGNGIQEFNINHGLVNISYSEIGEKVIRIYKSVIINGSKTMIGSEFIINIVADISETPSTIIESIEDSNYSAKTLDTESTIVKNNGAKAYVFHANNANEVIDKPVIIVQGFDPTGDINLDSQFDKYERYKNHLENIDNSYDFIFVTINNTNLSLNTNTYYLKDLIKKINLQKESKFESVVIGESMGGLLSRMALKELENEGYDHEVGLYVSFDAPHQGANIPPGLQHLFNDLISSKVITGIDAFTKILDFYLVHFPNIIYPALIATNNKTSINKALQLNVAYDALDALNSTAAKSMIINHIDPDGYFESTQEYLAELGYPEKTRNIALINGSRQNIDVQEKNDGSDLASGDVLIREPLWNDWCNEFSFNVWASNINTRSKVSEITFEIGFYVPEVIIKWENKCITPKIFGKCIKTKIPVKVPIGLTCATVPLSKTKYHTFDGAFHDGAPASTLPSVDSQLPIDIRSSFGFVSTASAIDISENAYNSTTDPSGLLAITNTATLNSFIENDLTPFDEVYAKNSNSDHVFFDFTGFPDDNSNMIDIIEDEIMPENLFIQNKEFLNDRNFEAVNNINIGNDVNTIATKIVETGNVLFSNNSTFSLEAGNEILLSNGVHIENGTEAHIFIEQTPASKNLSYNNPESFFDAKIIGSTNYSMGESAEFKVIVSNLDSEYNYSWELVEDTSINSVNDEFIIDKTLYPGFYTMKLSVTSKLSYETKEFTKVFKVSANYNNSESITNALTANDNINSVTIYPNPIKTSSTIISNKKIYKITISDLNGKSILEINDVNKVWNTINLSSFSTGNYIVNTYFEDGTKHSNKVIKQ